MHVAVLPNVDGCQMEPEHLDRADQRIQARLREHAGPVVVQRIRQHLQVADQFRRHPIRRHCPVRLADRLGSGDLEIKRGNARVKSRQGLAIRLALPMRRFVTGRIGECKHCVIDAHQSRRQRQLGAETMKLVEVMREQQPRMPRRGVAHRLGGDEWIAVAIAADPRADAYQWLQLMVDAEQFLGPHLHLRQHAQERQTEILDAVLDLVEHLQLRQAQHRGLPQHKYQASQRALGFIAFVVVGRAFVQRQRLRDLPFAIEDALPLHFRWMRSQHGADLHPVEQRVRHRRRDSRRMQRRERPLERARLGRRSRTPMRATTTILVDVLGDVREMREVAECADDVEDALDRQRVQLVIERANVDLAIDRFGAPISDRGLPGRLDDVEHVLAARRRDDLAEHAPEQSRVVTQRLFLVGVHVGGRIEVMVRGRKRPDRARVDHVGRASEQRGF